MAQNGRLPNSQLGAVQIGGRLRKDVVRQTDQMAVAFALEFHKALLATDTYRDYQQQVQVKAEKGPYAATPGTSNHGWGLAVDFASRINIDSSAEHKWMEKNAAKFGYENPLWARNATTADGMYEPWHWEAHPVKVNAPYVHKPFPGEMGIGWVSDLVKDYQKLLNQKGSIKIAEDGHYGFMTGVAVIAIQKKAGIPLTGKMTPATKRYLLGTKPAAPKPTKPATPPKRNPTRLPTIKKGSKSAWVRVIQNLVGAKVDGVFGPGTEAKVKDFQRRHGLKQDGVVGIRTWAQFLYGHALDRGDRGDRVKVLQNMVGLSGKAADGVFGNTTRGRVIEVQRGLGISIDGVAGPQFRNAYVKHFS